MTDIPTENNDHFKTVIAVLIAVVTVIGAMVAWRASLASGSAGDADLTGVTATLDTEETRTLNKANLYANYQAYTNYMLHNELGNLIAADLEHASTDETPHLQQQKTAAWDVAITDQNFFRSRYLDKDGNYNTERDLGEAWAEAGQQKDLNPEPHFAAADQLRAKANWLVGTLIILALALLVYTIAEGMSHRFKYALALGGTVFLLIGVGTALAVELLM